MSARKPSGPREIAQRGILVAGVAALAAASMLFAQKQPSAQHAAAVTWKLPANAKADAYVGAETCAGCHSEHAAEFAKTLHATAAPKKAAYGTGCESCHGPGKAHAEAMAEALGAPEKIPAAKKLIYGFHGKPAENTARCLNCHNTSSDQRLYERS